MFTGIISDLGTVRAILPAAGGVRMRIACGFSPETIAIGASIACSGPCLTVVDRGSTGEGGYFDVDVSSETLARTNLGSWSTGRRVNLERGLKMGDELDGHLVTGHVDGTAELIERQESGAMARLAFRVPGGLARFIAQKGSVCLDGTSLTVNAVEGERFEVMLIPHTLVVTTWGERQVGDAVNLEVDLLARYLDRLRSAA